jgi:acyl-CoA dehydrogenase
VDFEFSDDQTLVRDSVRRFLADRAPLAWVREHYGDPAVVDDTWRGLADLGLTGMLVPEDHGGGGTGLVDLALPLGEMGRTVFPGPFAASAVGATSLLAAIAPHPLADEWLPRLAGGGTGGAPMGCPPGRDGAARADETGGSGAAGSGLAGSGVAWSGTKTHVPDGAAADLVLVVLDPDTVVAARADDDGLTVAPLETVDGSRKFATVTGNRAGGTLVTGVTEALAGALDRLALAYVLDGVGAAERALELAVAYAAEREQFGRPIGAFQAVQHLCADMLRAVELGRAAAYYAAWACDAADATERHRAVTMARAFAADGFYRVGATAIQVFGGVGFTWEHDVHLFYKRLLTLQHFGGSAQDHLEELASLVF